MIPRIRRLSHDDLLGLLTVDVRAYGRLLDAHDGDLASAAHQLACARLVAGAVPTSGELWDAASTIVAAIDSFGGWIAECVPTADVLADDARRAGCPVLE